MAEGTTAPRTRRPFIKTAFGRRIIKDSPERQADLQKEHAKALKESLKGQEKETEKAAEKEEVPKSKTTKK
jgi:hypothetical protein